MSSIYRTLSGGTLRDIALACLAVWFIGLSYGAIAVASGFPLWVPAAQSVLVLAGASEFLFIGIVAAGGNPLAAAAAGLLVNARHLPYGLALPDMTGPDMTGPDMTGPHMTGPG
ncbi:MAG TPA: AzlC family ABC transporter permease, partial [Streptosporangiaceae bacterium]|nr:AzlC family ABC transporter permease [Streptosporangiaceae bacterium]